MALLSCRRRRLWTANLGDAEVWLGRRRTQSPVAPTADADADASSAGDSGDWEAVCLTHCHIAADAAESARIMGEGGIVINGRVAGKLAVARAFGDKEFKTVRILQCDPDASA